MQNATNAPNVDVIVHNSSTSKNGHFPICSQFFLYYENKLKVIVIISSYKSELKKIKY